MSNSEALLEDAFIQELRPFLRQLDWKQWQSILKRLAAISDQVAGGHAQLRSLAQPRSARMDDMTRRPINPPVIGHRYSDNWKVASD
jgi:hypothetical protein